MILETKNFGKKGKKYCICKCDECNKEFRRKFSDTQRSEFQYCSRTCARLNRKGGTKSQAWRDRMSIALTGRKFSDETKKKMSENHADLSGDKNGHWNGGRYQTKQGYWILKVDKKRIPEHRYIVEQILGRKLEKGEQVHHINEDKSDNRPENLMALPLGKHNILHYVIRFLNEYGSIENFYNQHRLI